MKQLLSILLLTLICSVAHADESALPPDSAYVTVNAAGQLQLDGKRVRYWGAIGKFPGVGFAGKDVDPYEVNIETVARLKLLGFNLVRLWEAPELNKPYTKGDKSRNDVLDHFVAECARNDIKIWWAGWGAAVGNVTAADVNLIDDPATAEAWKAAIGEKGRGLGKKSFIAVWDARARAKRIQRLTALANHVNQYTGRRYADEPTIVVWELVNEDWWMFNMTRGQFLRLHPYFVQSLTQQWNAYLTKKYSTAAGVRKAWANNLLDGESPEKGTVALLPLPRANLKDEQARTLGVAVDDAVSVDQSMFNVARGSDVIEFLTTIWIQQKTAERDALKPLGKSLRLSPMIFDTGIGSDLPTQYMHAQSDAIVHATYINGASHPDPSHKRFPWFSALEESPKLCWDKPWLENTRVKGKPFFIYENNIMQPAKYRAEYPMRIALLAMTNDIDIVCFHFWGMPRDPRKPDRYDQPMDVSQTEHPTQGYHFQYDLVLQASISAAGEIFKNSLLAPPEKPTEFVIGRKSLYSPAMIEFGPLLERFMPTAYRYGSRLVMDPTREDDEIIGPSLRRGIYEPTPIGSTKEMWADVAKGQIIFDGPKVATFTGFLSRETSYTFNSGIKLDNVSIVNDEAIAYPVKDDEKYLTFALTSDDGLPLAESKTMRMIAVSTSFNDGFAIDESKVREWFWGKGAITNDGKLPVRFARVSATLVAPQLTGCRYRVLDWHGKVVREGKVEAGQFQIDPADGALVYEFMRE
jgi:hypothetical protein